MINILIIYAFCLLIFVAIFYIGKVYRDRFFLRNASSHSGIALNALNLSPELTRYLGRIVSKDRRSRRTEGLP